MIEWPYFSNAEFKRIGSDPEMMDNEFMEALIELRQELNFPLPLTSAYRTPEHNKRIGGSKNSAHLEGRAVDINIWGARAYRLVSEVHLFGFMGLGIYQGGPKNKRFIHIDRVSSSPVRPRPTMWGPKL